MYETTGHITAVNTWPTLHVIQNILYVRSGLITAHMYGLRRKYMGYLFNITSYLQHKILSNLGLCLVQIKLFQFTENSPTSLVYEYLHLTLKYTVLDNKIACTIKLCNTPLYDI